MSIRIFYAAGPGNVIQAHRYWKDNKADQSELAISYSSQFEEFCEDIGADAYIISSYGKARTLYDSPFILEHRPKWKVHASGVMYHLSEVAYGLGLLITALRFGADVAVVNSGTTHFFVLSLFRLAGIRVVVVLHSALWPGGYPPKAAIQRMILWLDGVFFKRVATAAICLSPECVRQVRQIRGTAGCGLYEFRSQFSSEYFASISPPPALNGGPFRVFYAGRIIRNKGVFDILSMAQKIEAVAPGRVQWDICGSGPDIDELKHQLQLMDLELIVALHGWTFPPEMHAILAKSHISIIPTRSDCREGLAKTAVEAILAGRPIVTNPDAPALEILKPACLEAQLMT